MTTRTGRKFWPLDPRIEDISTFDIAWALSNICRFTGHAPFHYSVAQHSVTGVEIARIYDSSLTREQLVELQTAILFHDGAEAYFNDFCRPVKRLECFKEYSEAENRVQEMINHSVGLPFDAHRSAEVKKIDNCLLATEGSQFFDNYHEWVPGERPLLITIKEWDNPSMARELFLLAWETLRQGRPFKLPKEYGLT